MSANTSPSSQGREAPDRAQEQQQKSAAAEAALLVESATVVGLGAGSTTSYILPVLAKRARAGELRDVVYVACSAEVGARAALLGLQVVVLSERPRIDLCIDGADEVDPELRLLKGRGASLLYEKMVAQASRREVIVVDRSKLSSRLGTRARLAVEVFAFGWRSEELYLTELGGHPQVRSTDKGPFFTDSGNLVLDCDFGPLEDPARLSSLLDARAGIAAHGLFLNVATDVIVGGDNGVEHRVARRSCP